MSGNQDIKFQITDQDGNSVNLEVSPNITVRELKEAIAELGMIEVSDVIARRLKLEEETLFDDQIVGSVRGLADNGALNKIDLYERDGGVVRYLNRLEAGGEDPFTVLPDYLDNPSSGFSGDIIDLQNNNHIEVIMSAIAKDGEVFTFPHFNNFMDNKEFVLQALSVNGDVLELIYTDTGFRNDPEVVMEAIKKDPSAIEFASEDLRSLGVDGIQLAASRINEARRRDGDPHLLLGLLATKEWKQKEEEEVLVLE
ncbi:DUF4116 domain-containing protein [Rickettsiales bacterium]|nr:DUF4116 domain-containing protein [Rickettsiales bacterium]